VEKTFLRLNKELSIMILSLTIIIFTFISDYKPINNFISSLFIFIKAFIFVIVPFSCYFLEKSNDNFKKVAGIYTSYFIINLFITIVISFSFVNGVVPVIFDSLFNFVNLFILLTALFVFIEQLLVYNDISSKLYTISIMSIVYKLGEIISYPFLLFFNKQLYKKNDK